MIYADMQDFIDFLVKQNKNGKWLGRYVSDGFETVIDLFLAEYEFEVDRDNGVVIRVTDLSA